MNQEAQAPASDELWDLIDAVLVINLENRPERWAQFTKMAKTVIPEQKIHRIDAVYGRNLKGFGKRPWFRKRKRDHTWGARAGCILSHKKALKAASEKNWSNVLILEDDIEIDADLPKLSSSICKALQGPRSDWDLCYFGFTDPWGPLRSIAKVGNDRSLHQVYGCNCAHAYLVSADVREWLLKKLPDEENIWKWLSSNRAVDRWYRNTLGRHFKIYCLSPAIFNQAAGYSDIVGKKTGRHEDANHTTTISKASHRYLTFTLLYVFMICRSWGYETYDLCRGLVKKLRGF